MKMQFEQWTGFNTGMWTDIVDVDDFIRLNYRPYEGDESFLAGPTERTKIVSDRVKKLIAEEAAAGGVLKVDADRIMSATAYGPGYIDKERDIIAESQMLLLDIKHSDPKQFSKISGCSQKKLIQMIDMINETGTPVWVRQVIVPGINDTDDNVKALAQFVDKSLKNVYKVELLGYHTMALNKYEKLGMKYRLDGVKPMDKKKLQKLTKTLNSVRKG